MSKSGWKWLTLVTLTVLVWAFFFRQPTTFYAPASKRSQCKSNLKQFGLALHLYHEKYGSLPPPFVLGTDGTRWHSWRALLLPFMEVPEIANKYRYDEPWDGPNNRLLWNQCPEMYRCPASDSQTTKTHFLAVIGEETLWPNDGVGRIQDINRFARTVSVVEMRESVPWLAPVDLAIEDAISLWTSDVSVAKSHHANGRNVLMGDGAVQFVSPATLSREAWEAMLTRPVHGTDQESNFLYHGR